MFPTMFSGLLGFSGLSIIWGANFLQKKPSWSILYYTTIRFGNDEPPALIPTPLNNFSLQSSYGTPRNPPGIGLHRPNPARPSCNIPKQRLPYWQNFFFYPFPPEDPATTSVAERKEEAPRKDIAATMLYSNSWAKVSLKLRFEKYSQFYNLHTNKPNILAME